MALSDSDLQKIQDLLKITIAEDNTLVRKADIAHLPTKDEFYEEMSKVLNKLDRIQKIHPSGLHPTLS